MSEFIKLDFEFVGLRKRLNVAWSVLRTGSVTIVMEEDDFYAATSGMYDNLGEGKEEK